MPDRRWLASYDADVPPTLEPYPERTILDYLHRSAAERPRADALIFSGRSVSFGEVERRSDAFAAALAALGVRKGDRVALLLPNVPAFIIAEVGAWKAGAVVSPLNPIYTEHELAEALKRTGAETIVTLARFYTKVKNVQSGTALRRVIVSRTKDELPLHLRLAYRFARERRDGEMVELRGGDHWMGDLIRRHSRVRPPAVTLTRDDPALLLLSGGTTGTPKAAVGKHGALVRSGLQLHTWLQSILTKPDDRILLPLPLYHVYGCVGAQGIAFVAGHCLVLIANPRETNDVLHAVVNTNPTVFVGVPALFMALLNHRDVKSGKANFHSIRGCFSGSAPLLAETKRRFEELTGGTIVEGYSLTEAMMAVIANPAQGVRKVGSIGMPIPDVDVLIVDEETGATELPAGEVGEIIVRAWQVMDGYWHDPEETARTLRDRGDGGRWLFTGDLGYMDEDGYIFIVDRKKDLIKVGGLQVWPREIEEIIAKHPAVADVGVAGVPDERRGEMVKAWVVLREGATATEAEIRAHCRQTLASYKVPSRVEFRSQLPKNMIGKVLRRELRDEERTRRAGRS